jgi:hypothetical protein
MQIANATLALGGDHGNTVPKYGITVAEAVLLMHIHGTDALTEIEPLGEIERSDREEIARLTEVFARPEGTPSPVRAIYPGAMARVHRSFAELGIPDEQFKAAAFVHKAKPKTEAELRAEIEAQVRAELAMKVSEEAAAKPKRARKAKDTEEDGEKKADVGD